MSKIYQKIHSTMKEIFNHIKTLLFRQNGNHIWVFQSNRAATFSARRNCSSVQQISFVKFLVVNRNTGTTPHTSLLQRWSHQPGYPLLQPQQQVSSDKRRGRQKHQ
jgi:hypothetical protein